MIKEEVIIIGAGPCGLAAAIELKRSGFHPVIIEKSNIAHSISMYPTYMHFFSTPERLEIGDIPFTTPNDKPSRLEAINYYRTAALRNQLRINAYEAVLRVERQTDGLFHLTSTDRYGLEKQYESRYVVVATGYFDHPNYLGIPGEQMDKVTHFFREAHPYTGMEVAIIGGSNSAIDAALELERVGAKVTIIYRGEGYSRSIKPWVRPSIENKVNNGIIRMLFESRVVEIDSHHVIVENTEGRHTIANDFVLALTGFHPDREFLTNSGVKIEEEGFPYFDETTMETNVPGLYLAGVVASKHEANEIFIETGRFHGNKIAQHIASQR
jgi:putative bacillithiol system thiol disulfide oxidoreductase, YpdA family